MNGRITVIGSINIDLVVRADRLPLPGETILGGRFTQFHGGKGANQAVAAARAGAQVTMVGAVGDDAYGLMAVQALRDEGIDVSRVRTVDAPTGVALIGVGARGENMILVAPGANAELTEDDIDLADAAVLLTNFEVPLPVALAAVRAARAAGAIPVLTPAPAHALSADLLELAPVFVPNEHELTVMIGNDDPAAALEEVTGNTSGAVVVTQGPAGALLGRGTERRRFDSPRPVADPVDTTGAGDAFVGALAAWLASGQSLEEAIGAGNAAGALSVMAAGARAGLPGRRAIDELLAG